MAKHSLLDALFGAGFEPSKYPQLLAAEQRSERAIAQARTYLREQFPDGTNSIDMIAFGSLARRELTAESDFDYLVASYDITTPPEVAERMLLAAGPLRELLGSVERAVGARALRGPGATGMFGRVIAIPSLVSHIGLQQDDNHNHTRRMLLLEESVSLFRPDLHDKLIRLYLEPISCGSGRRR